MVLFHFHFIYAVSDHSPEMMELEVEHEFELWCQGYKD
jgi:hypothetical protein